MATTKKDPADPTAPSTAEHSTDESSTPPATDPAADTTTPPPDAPDTAGGPSGSGDSQGDAGADAPKGDAATDQSAPPADPVIDAPPAPPADPVPTFPANIFPVTAKASSKSFDELEAEIRGWGPGYLPVDHGLDQFELALYLTQLLGSQRAGRPTPAFDGDWLLVYRQYLEDLEEWESRQDA